MADENGFGPDDLGAGDDCVASFQLEGRPVRGRVVRLAETADLLLGAHDYPVSVARLVGEAALLAVLIGDSLKFDGKLIIQASGPSSHGKQVEGEGPVAFVVADFVPGEGVRGYAKYDAERVRTLEAATGSAVGAQMLLGGGHFAMTVDPGPGMERYQGVTAIEGESLAEAAEHYFAQSEQVPSRLKLAVGRYHDGTKERWRAGGALIQRIAADETRGETDGDFDHARALFDTLGDDELIDPTLSVGRVLYRLFHEEGVRLEDVRPAPRRCACTQERLAELLARFNTSDREHMSDETGEVVMTCEYCNQEWRFSAAEIDQAGKAND
ncbi:MAG: Hsp33 family molecular chaperone HslO [Alphaproteobacteria bacterium]|nr:Hsp33 family molecular chaperone HslO [Alphaproteobacteria bacterium]